MSMYKVNCKYAEQEEMILEAELQEEEKTKKKKLLLVVRDAEGVRRQIGNFSMKDITTGKAVRSVAEVFPDMLFETAKETETNEMDRVQEQLKNVIMTGKAVKSKQSMDIKMVHKEVCDYVRTHSRLDYYVIENEVCKIRYSELSIILGKILETGWSCLDFVRGLQLQEMVDEGNDRPQKRLTDSTGEQYRALVFSAQFRG